MQVQYLCQEDPLDVNPLQQWPGESSWTEESGGLQYVGSQRVGHDKAT